MVLLLFDHAITLLRSKFENFSASLTVSPLIDSIRSSANSMVLFASRIWGSTKNCMDVPESRTAARSLQAPYTYFSLHSKAVSWQGSGSLAKVFIYLFIYLCVCIYTYIHTRIHTHTSAFQRKMLTRSSGYNYNIGWRERNQHDATNLVFIIKLLSQHVSGIIMPIFMRTRLCITAYGVLHCNKRGKTP